MNKTKDEYDTFEHNMRELLKVPHTDIKAKLEEEKAAKKKNKVKRNAKDENGRSN
jgi:hypothetical protein